MNLKFRPLVLVLFAALSLWGCRVQPRDDFQNKGQKPITLKPDSTAAAKNESSKMIPIPAGVQFGFALVLTGPAQVEFYDESDRHTGPATKDEYLPVLESILAQPGLHEQEKANLEAQKERIILTGSAAEFFINRGIPNLMFKSTAERKEASFKGGEEILMKIETPEAAQLNLVLKVWNHKQAKEAQYVIDAGPEQSGEISISSIMDDFTLEWDENADDKPEKHLQPAKLDSMAVVGPGTPSAPDPQKTQAAPKTPATPAAPVPPPKTGK